LRGNVAYLARHGATPELVSELEADAERLARLADDLLALSREESAAQPTEPVRLDELAVEVGRGRALVSAPEPVTVRGDRQALERALLNLIRNAELHGPAAGRIEVQATQEDGRARITVRDQGEGLSAEDASKAFDRFWRGRQEDGGSGLGLAIVRATAERHGGQAYARGSTFTIELPALRDISGTGRRTEAAQEKGST
jgi:signal transduction histidine kinase